MMFEAVTIAGVDNTIGMPIYLLPLTEAGDQTASVDATTEGEITVSNMPGFELSIPAGSATFGDGSTTGTISVTQVHRDKVPMPPPGGLAPKMVFTIQPPDVVFDPPAPITYPNAEGHPPGAIVELFSFDHDLGQFVSIGTGQVSEDGLLIESDPGVGIIKGGWHYPAPGPSGGTCSGTGFPCEDLDPTDCLDISGIVNACAGTECDETERPVCAICGSSGAMVCDANVQCVTPQVTLTPTTLSLDLTESPMGQIEINTHPPNTNSDSQCPNAFVNVSNTNVASVDPSVAIDGEVLTVTAQGVGTATITATYAGAVSNSVTVKVIKTHTFTCDRDIPSPPDPNTVFVCELCRLDSLGFCADFSFDNALSAICLDASKAETLVCNATGSFEFSFVEQ